jgi:tetratricopeptide (TPR) repeat protein
VGVVGIVIAALFFSRYRDSVAIPLTPGRPMIATAGLASAAIIAFAACVFVSGELKQRAQVEYQEKKPLVAIETLKLAQTIMPFDSSLFHDAGEILLDVSQRPPNPEYLAAATTSFQRAIALSPQKVGPHVGYGLALSQAGHVDEALAEVAVAQSLYPRGAYPRSISKLMNKRKASAAQ